MRSAPEAPAAYPTLDALPDDARALFGTGLFDSLAWYRVLVETALPAGAHAAFVVAGVPARVVFPMLVLPRGAGALAAPYTCLWSPLTVPDADAAALHEAGRALAAWCRPRGIVRLDALDLADPRWPPILAGVRAAGLVPLAFNHFGNWHTDLGYADFDSYLAARPGALRATFKRRGARLRDGGAALRIVTGGAALEPAIAAYDTVYARSWKPAEPFPAFNAALMRACAAEGSLRLALLERDGKTLAAQFWVVQAGTATVLKLAYDAAERAHSPGTVLTGLAIRWLMQNEVLTQLDFGRGDDGYKRDWTGARRQRSGVLLVDPWRPWGIFALLRHWAGQHRRAAVRHRP